MFLSLMTRGIWGNLCLGQNGWSRPSPAACWTGKKSIPASSLVKCSMNRKKEKLEQKRHEAQETEAKLNLGHEIDSIVKAAEKMAGPSDGRPKAERLSGIRQNRKEERGGNPAAGGIHAKKKKTADISSHKRRRKFPLCCR